MYSKLDDIPYCFSGETSFINFCAIRSFPNTQIQRVIDDLEENWLPWADDIVRVLLQVTLGQVEARFGLAGKAERAVDEEGGEASKHTERSVGAGSRGEVCEQLLPFLHRHSLL